MNGDAPSCHSPEPPFAAGACGTPVAGTIGWTITGTMAGIMTPEELGQRGIRHEERAGNRVDNGVRFRGDHQLPRRNAGSLRAETSDSGSIRPVTVSSHRSYRSCPPHLLVRGPVLLCPSPCDTALCGTLPAPVAAQTTAWQSAGQARSQTARGQCAASPPGDSVGGRCRRKNESALQTRLCWSCRAGRVVGSRAPKGKSLIV